VAVGARFDDRVTGKISEFAPKAIKAHVDIDPSAISKSVAVDIAVVGHARLVLKQLLPLLDAEPRREWVREVRGWIQGFPFAYDRQTPELLPQYVIEQIYEVTRGNAIITTDVGQHQMWSAHFYKYARPRQFISSGGLGTMGFGLPAAIGAPIRLPRQDRGVHRGRRQHPDELPGAGGGRGARAADQRGHPEQRVPGHGAAVAGDVL